MMQIKQNVKYQRSIFMKTKDGLFLKSKKNQSYVYSFITGVLC